MSQPLRILLIGDGIAEAAVSGLQPGAQEPSIGRATTVEELQGALRGNWDVAICNSSTAGMGAQAVLHAMQEAGAKFPLLVIPAPLDEQARLTQKMDAVARLAGSVAHDFNNFLTVIDGYSDLLLTSREFKGFHLTALEEIRKSAAHAAALTKQLLAFSRRQHLELRAIDVREMSKRLEQMIRPKLGGKIELIMIPPASPGMVEADLSLLEHVVLNLVANASDAMPEGGKLTVETTIVDWSEGGSAALRGLRPGRYALISISDTGTGMSQKTRSHLFEPYFTTKSPGRGTGLSLATSYGIIRQSGGAIEFQSESGKGTTARIYLPTKIE